MIVESLALILVVTTVTVPCGPACWGLSLPSMLVLGGELPPPKLAIHHKVLKRAQGIGEQKVLVTIDLPVPVL